MNNFRSNKSFSNMRKSNNDKVIGGVCGALGEYTQIPSWMWRALFLCSVLFGGIGVFIYIILCICMPKRNYHNI
jgi:phage shock protein C